MKKICPTCDGEGYVRDSDPESQQPVALECFFCDGKGKIYSELVDGLHTSH